METEEDIEAAVDEIISTIEDHELSSSRVARRTTVQFYTGLLERLGDLRSTVQGEAEAEDEETEGEDE